MNRGLCLFLLMIFLPICFACSEKTDNNVETNTKSTNSQNKTITFDGNAIVYGRVADYLTGEGLNANVKIILENGEQLEKQTAIIVADDNINKGAYDSKEDKGWFYFEGIDAGKHTIQIEVKEDDQNNFEYGIWQTKFYIPETKSAYYKVIMSPKKDFVGMTKGFEGSVTVIMADDRTAVESANIILSKYDNFIHERVSITNEDGVAKFKKISGSENDISYNILAKPIDVDGDSCFDIVGIPNHDDLSKIKPYSIIEMKEVGKRSPAFMFVSNIIEYGGYNFLKSHEAIKYFFNMPVESSIGVGMKCLECDDTECHKLKESSVEIGLSLKSTADDMLTILDPTSSFKLFGNYSCSCNEDLMLSVRTKTNCEDEKSELTIAKIKQFFVIPDKIYVQFQKSRNCPEKCGNQCVIGPVIDTGFDGIPFEDKDKTMKQCIPCELDQEISIIPKSLFDGRVLGDPIQIDC